MRSTFSLSLFVALLASSSLAAPLPRPETVTPSDISPAEILAESRDGRMLFLASLIFDPTIQRPDFTRFDLGQGEPTEYAIIQFKPGKGAMRAELEKRGAKFFGYLPDNAFQVRLSPSARSYVEKSDAVRWHGRYEPGFKIHPRIFPGSGDSGTQMTLVTFPDASLGKVIATLRAEFPQVLLLHSRDSATSKRARFSAPPQLRDAFVRRAASLASVSWLEPYDELEYHNANSSGPIQGNLAGEPGRTIYAKGITGTGQVVAVADSGVDTDMCFFRNLNGNNAVTLASRTMQPEVGTSAPSQKIIGYWVQNGADAYDTNAACSDVPTGFHGTHVAGSAVGDNPATPSSPSVGGVDPGDGMAPNAQLLFQDIGASTGCLSGINDAPATFLQALRGGARIHSDSYGSGTNGAYTAGDEEADRFLFDNEEMTIFFSAGNRGANPTTIGSPGNSKNVVTVGAMANGISTNAAGFSSRGPTRDGRIKPDIQAPGSSIISASGDVNETNANCSVKPLSGTSMSCPTAAGGAALLRQYFVDGFYPGGSRNPADGFSPNAPLVKAVLLNGAFALPAAGRFGDFTFGWGRMFLDSNLFFTGDARKLRVWNITNANGMKTADTHSYRVRVGAGQEFRATLAWSDPEGTLGAAVSLVNNLDLTVTTEAGTFLGNMFSTSGESVPGGEADSKNNVEQIRFTTPVAGTYTITVTGANIPGTGRATTNRQGYALVTSQATCPSAVVTPPTSVTAATNPQRGVDVTWSGAAGAGLFQIYRASVGCGTPGADYQYIGSSSTNRFTDSTAQGGFTYSYKVRGADDCGEGPVSICVTILATGLCDLAPTFAGVGTAEPDGTNCRINLSFAAGRANCPLGQALRYNIYRSTDPSFTPSGAPYATVTGTTFSDLNVMNGVTYYYIVRAEDSVTGSTGPNRGNEEPNVSRLSATPFGPPGAPGTFVDNGGDTAATLTLTSPWNISSSVAQSGSRSYHSAFEGSDYPGETCSAITSPKLTLAANAELSYFARYNFEFRWDGVIVEISENNGATWVDLPPTGGYPSTLAETEPPGSQSPVNECGYRSSQGAFTGPSGNASLTPWTQFRSSLAAFNGKEVRIRWRMTTDPSAEYEGFYLDTIAITNVRLPGNCIVLAQQPVAGFTVSPRSPLAGQPVTFRDTSTNVPTTYRWEFGDGGVSTDPSPTHVYTTPGSYTVKLTVSNAAGSSEFSRVISVTSASNVYVPLLIVPGASRAQGSGGSFFKTALWMTNTGTTETVVRLRYVPAPGQTLGGGEETVIVSIAPNRSASFADLLGEGFGVTTNTSGVVLVEVAQGRSTPVVTSRTFNEPGGAGTFGQYIPAVALSGGENASSIEGLGGDVTNRSNVGIVNLTDSAFTAILSVFDAAGVKRGSDVSITVPARSAVQENRINTRAGAGDLAVFSVRITAPGRFFAYASKLDNLTSDPIFIPSTLTARSRQFIDGVGSIQGGNNTTFRSSLTLANRSTVPAVVTIAFTRRGETAPSANAQVNVAAGATQFFADVVRDLYNLQAAGSLTLTSQGAPVLAWARTYSDRGALGTLGQFIPAFGDEDLISLRGAILQGLSETPAYRTNLGLVNTGTETVTVTVAVWSRDGIRLAQTPYTLAGGQAMFVGRVINSIASNENVADGYLTVTPSIGGRVYAWASFVDNVSTDQTFVRPIAIP